MKTEPSNRLRFAAVTAAPEAPTSRPWKMLIVDDEPAVHQVTKLALRGFTFCDRPLAFLGAASAREACALLDEHPDIAVILLDVVMETESAGVDVIRYVRTTLNNRAVRIILRTGQAGRAPPQEFTMMYDINDYKEKTELTAQKLSISVYTALRAYRDIAALEANRKGLETVLNATACLFGLREFRAFVEGVLEQLVALLCLDQDSLFCQADAVAATAQDGRFLVLAATGDFAPAVGRDISDLDDAQVVTAIHEAHARKAAVSRAEGLYATHFTTERGYETVLCVRGRFRWDGSSQSLIDLFVRNVSVAYDNLRLQVDLSTEIAERREAERAAAILARLPGELPEPVLRVTEAGELAYANQASAPLLAYFETAVGGRLPETWCAQMRHLLQAGARLDMEIAFEARLFEVCFSPVPEAGYVNVFGRDVTRVRDLKDRLEHTAIHDPLTEIPNRQYFRDRIERALLLASRHETRVGLILLDLDRFKQINDACGHHTGDRVLQGVASRLTATVRDSDVVARLGGDEFGILVAPLDSTQVLSQLAERIQKALCSPLVVQGRQFSLGCAVGIAVSPGDGERAEDLLRSAEIAMYQGKHSTKERISFYDPGLQKQARETLELEELLRWALEHDGFEVFYQPFFSLSDQRLIGAEALLRLRRPDGTLMAPTRFIPVAEATGLIEPIGEWVVRQTCSDLRTWLDLEAEVPPIAFNISARQLSSGTLPGRIETILASLDIPARLLEAEITESVLIEEPVEATRQLTRLKEIGLSLAIDDFGTGYSSLSYLRHLPVSKLKIDRTFVADMLSCEDAAAIVDAILALGRSLRLRVIAEGIDQWDQVLILREMGCEEGQGFLFSPPIPGPDFGLMLAPG